ncbi:hypothetical protein JHK82_012510 [Glycine max]|nr:hypothetical protein JHK85_012864 [Glycine max]KAG5154541.1 hypothetical protein JHK82_012510 [Glycine max]
MLGSMYESFDQCLFRSIESTHIFHLTFCFFTRTMLVLLMGTQEDKKKIMGIVEEAHNMTIVGKGNEIVILTHGFGTDQSVWKHLVPHLVDDYRVVLYDNIGAGTTNPDYFDNIGAGTYSPSCKSFRCNLASSLVTLSPLWWASSLPSLTLISSPNSSSSLLLKGKINL